jgi:hypothetical protein
MCVCVCVCVCAHLSVFEVALRTVHVVQEQRPLPHVLFTYAAYLRVSARITEQQQPGHTNRASSLSWVWR